MCHPAAPSARPVLVADAHRDAADALALWGYQPLTAYDGAAALELARRHRPDALLSELHLPGLSGLELARELRPNVPCRVAITSHARPSDRQHCRDAGFDHVLLKPGDADELHGLLAGYARGRRPGRVSRPAVARTRPARPRAAPGRPAW